MISYIVYVNSNTANNNIYYYDEPNYLYDILTLETR